MERRSEPGMTRHVWLQLRLTMSKLFVSLRSAIRSGTTTSSTWSFPWWRSTWMGWPTTPTWSPTTGPSTPRRLTCSWLLAPAGKVSGRCKHGDAPPGSLIQDQLVREEVNAGPSRDRGHFDRRKLTRRSLDIRSLHQWNQRGTRGGGGFSGYRKAAGLTEGAEPVLQSDHR